MVSATALAASWKQVYTDNNDNAIFFDTDSVVASFTEAGADATFGAMYRMDYSEKGRKAMIDWYREYSVMPPGIDNLSYDISTVYFKKVGDKRYYYIGERVCYTANGATIPDMHYEQKQPNWQEISPGSVVDVEYFEAALIVEGKKYDRD